MSSFTILIDTGCDLPRTYLDEHSIETIPIPFNLDGVQHDGGRWQKISDKDFYKALGSGSKAGTALINPEEFVAAFSEYAKNDKEVLVILLSSGLSGTYQNSVIALNDVKEKYPNANIHVIDSINASGGIGLVTALAVKKREEGLTAAETAAWLEEKKHSCFSLFTVNDLMYLHRGGRLSKLSAVAGSIIGIKPVLNVDVDGTLKLKDKARGRKGALDKLCSQMIRSLDPGTKLDKVIIIHSDCIDDAEALAGKLRSELDINEILFDMMGPVIGAHVGPGTIALFFEGDMSRTDYEVKFYGK